ncbi:MAG: hypothetical protein FWG47_05220 [Propionibacteriaceae bacterium]|nr:hypothetical protein [Propionibacteriaceae bacterium]
MNSHVPPVAQMNMPTPIELPLAEYVQILEQAQQAINDEWYETTKPVFDQREKLIAECMKKAGFEYRAGTLPAQTNSEIWGGLTLQVPWLPADRDDVAEFGYGSYVLRNPDADISEGWQWNDEYVERLSTKARHEYMFALSGRDGYELSKTPGCVERAEKVTGSVDSIYSADNSWFETAYLLAYSIFGIGIEDEGAPPRAGSLQAATFELNREWASCIAEIGVATPFRSDYLESIGPFAYFTRATRGTVEDMRAVRPPSPEFSRPLALADFDCRVKTDYVNRFTQIQFDLEQQILDKNQAVFDKLVATWEQKRK